MRTILALGLGLLVSGTAFAGTAQNGNYMRKQALEATGASNSAVTTNSHVYFISLRFSQPERGNCRM